MHKMLLEVPDRIEARRLYLRSYQAGDGQWYYATSQKNQAHLARYEAGNVVMSIASEQDAENVVQGLAAEWRARNCFFMGAFNRETDQFVAQVYVGPVNWDVPEFEIGFFVDVDYEGQGYITEAATAALGFIFEHLKAHRVRMECDDTNERSRRVAERCGMVKEGHIRENKRNADGQLSGTLYFGLLKSEFEALENR
ncbi:MAG: GNAT family N-acetyltransferase [Chloroflexi bacterium]|nr:GNAT family N-acetyltransferase [Chloroflexota bacterium]MBU1746398.1 GNAT family N-acetyltransferase [Chloroflexota bacterium]